MPDKRRHRGQNPEDVLLFNASNIKIINEAYKDLNFLFSRGYSEKSALKVVGDRYFLKERQRIALTKVCCSDISLIKRKDKLINKKDCVGKSLFLDGYNILITLECVLSGGLIFKGRDGCYRDIASLHGNYRKVEETIPSIELLGDFLLELAPLEVKIYLDSPISNSGRLKQLMLEISERKNWNWKVELAFNPDKSLISSQGIVGSTDSWVIENSFQWLNITPLIIEAKGINTNLITFID